jgi:hypothetical protein
LGTKYQNFLIISGRGGPVAFEIINQQQRLLKDVVKNLEKLAKRNASPEATEHFVPAIMEQFSIPVDRKEQYTKRVRAGLFQYYVRHYRPTTSMETSEFDGGSEFDHP